MPGHRRCTPLLALAVLLAGVVACGDAADPPAPAPAPAPAGTAPAGTAPVDAATEHPAFSVYILALTWSPSFCCSHAGKAECRDLAGSFAATHLTLHGLWPNYSDAEANGRTPAWPEFCGRYARCKSSHEASCEPGSASVPAEMRDLGPGDVGDHAFLASHEWPKHGSCTGLTPAAYFRAAVDAMKSLPGNGTPDKLREAIGGEIALGDLTRSFGVPATSVLLDCDSRCELQQIGFCLARDRDGKPTTPIPCPVNTSSSRSDNGCVTRRCEQVRVAAANACDREPRPERRSHDERRKQGVHACNRPGQGPSCTGDADCAQAGYQRCARSGCCTNQPR